MKKSLNLENIQSAMDKMGLNQATLARELDISRESVSKWFKSDSLPKPDKLLRLGIILGLPFDKLVIKVDPNAPVVAFRKMGNRKTTAEHLQKAADMGRLLTEVVPYLPFDQLAQPSILKSPILDYAYLQSVAKKIRKEVHVTESGVIDFIHLVRYFNEMQAVLIPVLWGAKDRHENATHIYLPDSMTTWVYLNLDVNVHDFKFWMAHELGHVLASQLRGEEAEDYADAFAGALLFPEQLASDLYSKIKGKAVSRQINMLKTWADKLVISPYTIYRQLNSYASANKLPELKLGNIGGAVTNFNKQYPNVSEVLFSNEEINPRTYISLVTDQFESPFFKALGKYLRESGKSASFIKTILDINLLDAKGIYAELT